MSQAARCKKRTRGDERAQAQGSWTLHNRQTKLTRSFSRRHTYDGGENEQKTQNLFHQDLKRKTFAQANFCGRADPLRSHTVGGGSREQGCRSLENIFSCVFHICTSEGAVLLDALIFSPTHREDVSNAQRWKRDAKCNRQNAVAS